jgi:Zn-dependent protease with chaperone function
VARFDVGEFVHPFDQSVPSPEHGEAELPGSPLTPEEWPELHAALAAICAAFGLAVPPLRRAKRAAQGCLFGQAGAAVIAAEELIDLRSDLRPDELVAVLAHQCGHLLLGRPWTERAELSADRAAAAYLGDADPITRAIFRFAGADAPAMLAMRIREIQAWAATPGFARLQADR